MPVPATGVAVVCTVVRDPGIFVTDAATKKFRAERPYDTLEVYAQSGHRWTWAEYRVGPEVPGTAGRQNADHPPVLPRPPGWPDLDPAAAVAWVREKDAPPADRYAQDGQHIWRGVGPFPPTYQEPVGAEDAAWLTFPGRLWPGRSALHAYYPWSVGTHRANADGTETVEYADDASQKKSHLSARVLKLDARTGLPIEFVRRENLTASADVLWRTVRTTFASTLQTPAGVELPERWTFEEVRGAPDTMTVRPEGRLRFDPAVKVPESWYGPPAVRDTKR